MNVHKRIRSYMYAYLLDQPMAKAELEKTTRPTPASTAASHISAVLFGLTQRSLRDVHSAP